MCGICGIVSGDRSEEELRSSVVRMSGLLQHRGPDDEGVLAETPIGLGSRRLSILDLSENGHMPMLSDDDRYAIVHNGEIYNYVELREILIGRGYRFKSATDTEVVLNLYREFGAECLSMCNGMFAFAIWDRIEKCLFLARDRLGVKPVYYAVEAGSLIFASEPKALFAAGFPPQFDDRSWDELLAFRYVAGSSTPSVGVRRLLPGHFLRWKGGRLETRQWFSLSRTVSEARSEEPVGDPGQGFGELFLDSVRLRKISDVPVGVLLSGGLDSAAVAAAMAMSGNDQTSSFTIRFTEDEYDEGPRALDVAQMWGLDHHEVYVEPTEIPSLLQEATWLLDEPLVHASDLHLLAVARFAKFHVSVLLSGEGSDEINGGYVRYRPFAYPWLFSAASAASKIVRNSRLQDRVAKTLYLARLKDPTERLLYSSAELLPAEAMAQISTDFPFRREVLAEAQKVFEDPVRQVMYYEQQTYLQSLLDRNDRMTMGASIECRVPFLDHRLVRFTFGQSSGAMFRRGQGKMLLRSFMTPHLPESVLRSAKWGFGVPWNLYLRKVDVLRDWLLEIPSHEIVRSGPLELDSVSAAIREYLDGDDRLAPLVRLLLHLTLWEEICVRSNRNALV
jgi:asparagine synthase (glutamine-hydrolysing)